MNIYMSVGVPAVCAFAVPLRMHMHVQHVSGSVCPLVFLCVTSVSLCDLASLWQHLCLSGDRLHLSAVITTAAVVYLMVKAQFARSHITLIFMFVALKGP